MTFLLAFLGWGKMLAQGVIGWLSRRSLSEICALGLAIVCLVLFITHKADQREVRKLKAQISACSSARKADAQAYANAQKAAQAANIAHVQQIEQQQQRITDATETAYQRDHAELIRLRQQQLAAHQGSTGPAGPSAPSAPTAGADGDGLHLSADQYLQAQEVELRLMHLQNWVAQQLAIDPNK